MLRDEFVLAIHLAAGHQLEEALQNETLALSTIIDKDRIRGDYGDLNSLVASIREFGIIQPIVLQRNGGGSPVLVAGGRRLAALRLLGTVALCHGKDFVWRDEDLSTSEGIVRLQAIELEENLRRKDLEWSEVVAGKKRLLALMQQLHGEAKVGKPSREDVRTGQLGFGVVKLAAMLGENPSMTSRDLQLAELVGKFPSLAKLPTKQDAFRKLNVAVTVATMQAAGAAKQGADSNAKNWTLFQGDFQKSIQNIPDMSVDLVATDLPYACGLGDSTAAHGAGLGGFGDTFSATDLTDLLNDVAEESYRILKPDRFAVFFFGFAYYKELCDAMANVGFILDAYPFIWIRDRTAPPSPSRYAKTYDPALICAKGNPTLLRANLGNSMAIASVRGGDRLHAAQKPVELMERFVLDMTAAGATVVDLMAGSGTTGVASLKNKRRVILFEKEPANCVLIESRLNAIK